ncbi:MAG: acyltransferase [Thermodesulfovibrionales bacterium]
MKKIHRVMEDMSSSRRLAAGRLRARMLSLRGAMVNKKVFVDVRCRVVRPWCLTIGLRCLIESDVYIKAVDDAAALILGDYVFIGKGTEFDIQEKVTIGDHTIIAPHCFITDHSHGISAGLRIDQQLCSSGKVTIGRDVWLGTKAVILSGVTIGDGAIVGAAAVVTRDVPEKAVVAGSPARVLRFRQ